MPKYIDADALMKEFIDFVRDANNSDFVPVPTWNDAVSLVGSAPTVTTDLSDYSDRLWQAAHERGKAEAAEVVRCKDCEFYYTDEKWCRRLGLCGAFDADDYCSHGERKEGGAE